MTAPKCTDMERRVAAVLAERAGLVANEGAIARHLGDARACIRAMRDASPEIYGILNDMGSDVAREHIDICNGTHVGFPKGNPFPMSWWSRGELLQKWHTIIDAASPEQP